jgi:IS30 family transposase
MTRTGRPLTANPVIREFALEQLNKGLSSRKVVQAIQDRFDVKVCFNTILNWRHASPERRKLDLDRIVTLADRLKPIAKEYSKDEILAVLDILGGTR